MDANQVLDFLKVLLWPIVTLTIVLMFRTHLGRLFQQVTDRVGTAEILKVGIAGQHVEISGTAKELANERARLAQGADPQISTEKLQTIDQASRELSNPIADVIGLKLFQASGGVRIENLVHAAIAAFVPDKRPAENAQMFILAMRTGVEKILDALRALGYVEAKADEYMLTSPGRAFYQRVEHYRSDFLTRFKALKRNTASDFKS
jgi:hypothetical protein